MKRLTSRKMQGKALDVPDWQIYLHVTLACLTNLEFYPFVMRRLQARFYRSLGIPCDHDKKAKLSNVYADHIDRHSDIPIDLVYTWVDGSSPDHARARHHWAIQLGADPIEAMSRQRFIDHGELRLSLRSVERYLPWIRHVFIVTNGQTPHWLDTNHPKVSVIHHEAIFSDSACLPTFNSHAIEFQLHRIPGLSEHFLYCNDDMFLSSACSKEDFFTFSSSDPGRALPNLQLSCFILPACLYTRHRQRHRLHWHRAWNNLQVLLEHDFHPHRVRNHLLHQVTPLKKTCLELAATLYPDLYASISASRFRSLRDVPPIGLASYLGLLRQEAVLKPISNYYLSTLQGLRDYLAGCPWAKLCCINSLMEGTDVCEPIADLSFCTEPSSFEKPVTGEHEEQFPVEPIAL